ncbi:MULTISPECIES: PepSY domain-containing protein [Bacillus]|uniref:PepSY domain-containing protein n=1 Tax=Bacillus TaxID=1386 RepID=UPI0002F44BE8|nr:MULTISPECIES: PepSY domain-containing protein [Bacillus]
MKWKDLALGVAIGFACGYAAKCTVEKYAQQSPDEILSKVKNAMKQEGKIIGSWILMKPEKYVKSGLEYDVFKGGLTKITDDEQKQLSFVADASTGTVIEISEQ